MTGTAATPDDPPRPATSAMSPATLEHPAAEEILRWWDVHQRELPWRATRDVYAIWVAEVMSSQTSVLRAVAAWEAWMARWPTLESLAAASLADVLAQWTGLGYPRRARDLHRSARIVAAEGWPAPDRLTTLPGIGPYVAAAIRCFALEQAVLPRDVNVNRVLARRFPAGLDISLAPWRAGQALMEFGQRVCTVSPDCGGCPAAGGCPGPGTHETAQRARRRQKPYADSLRQRRGELLTRVLHAGPVSREDADAEAAQTLITDGLIRAENDRLYPPD